MNHSQSVANIPLFARLETVKMFVIGAVVHTFKLRNLSLPSASEETIQLKDGSRRKVLFEVFEKDPDFEEARLQYLKVKATLDHCHKGEILSGLMYYRDKNGYERTISDATPSRETVSTSWLILKEKCMKIRKIRLFIQIVADKNSYAKQEAEEEMLRGRLLELTRFYADMMRGELLADMKIVCDEVRFPTHKLILSKGSEVFAAMLSHGSVLETQKKEIVIKDTNRITMDLFLDYIYAASLPNDLSFDGYAELLKVAHMYQVQMLIGFCVKKMRKSLRTDYATQGAIFGHLFGEQKLKKDSLKLIVNAETCLSSLDGYDELQCYPDILNDIIAYFHKSF